MLGSLRLMTIVAAVLLTRQAAQGQAGTVASHQKISDTDGDFTGILDNIDQFGNSVASLGDLDGDGVRDLAVGARRDDDGAVPQNERGAVWVLFLNADGTVKAHQKISDTEGGFTGTLDNNDVFGTSVAALGDLDGDTVADLAVGAPGDDDGSPGNFPGAVWVLFLNSDGTVKSHQKISATEGGFTGTLDAFDFFGGSVASLGDLDGDGVGDLAVGAHLDDDTGMAGDADGGAVWVLLLNPDGTVKAHQKISATQGGFTGTLAGGDHFGFSVGAPGDVDGDGVPDLVVGAHRDDDGGIPPNAQRGAVWVLFLNSDGTVKAHQKISDTEGGFTGTLDDFDEFGTSVGSLGDVDGDGVGDLAVGAEGDDDGGSARGAVWILFLNSDGTVKSHQKISATQGGFSGMLDNGDFFGVSVSAAGDVDGDGVGDLAVGAEGNDDGGSSRGAVWILFVNGVPGVTFDDPLEFPATGEPNIQATGAFDAGDTVDVIIAVPAVDPLCDGSVQLFLNQGNDPWLGFVANPPITVGREPSGLAVGQLNPKTDAFLDVAVTNAGDNKVFVLLGNGDGTFAPLPIEIIVGTQPSAIVAGDFTEDGFTDLAVANAGDNNVVILINDGDASFIQGALLNAGTTPVSMEAEDLDDNKCLDLAVVNAGSHDVSVFFNTGGGNFGAPLILGVGAAPLDLAIGDLDDNGFADIVTANNGDGTVSVILNNGGGVFDAAFPELVGANPLSVDAVDLDGDLDLDLAVVADDPTIGPAVQVLENHAGGGSVIFAPPIPFSVAAVPNFVVSSDLNDDGASDLVTVNADDGRTGGSVTALLGHPCFSDVNGDGTVNVLDLIDLLLCFGQPAVPGCELADVNRDGVVNVLDLIELLLDFGQACTDL